MPVHGAVLSYHGVYTALQALYIYTLCVGRKWTPSHWTGSEARQGEAAHPRGGHPSVPALLWTWHRLSCVVAVSVFPAALQTRK